MTGDDHGGRYIDLLKSGSFQAFMWTQFLAAINDNMYKYVAAVLCVQIAGNSGVANRYVSAGLAVYVTPFLFFAGYAGWASDRFNKRAVLIGTMFWDILVMIVATFAFSGSVVELVGVMFLTGTQLTFFSPAKYGLLPEILPERHLSRANGLMEMTLFLAIVLGPALGGTLLHFWHGEPYRIGIVMIVLAVIGTLISFGIPRVHNATSRPLRWNPLGEVFAGVAHIFRDRPLRITVCGISFFFFLAGLVQTELVIFGKSVLNVDDFWTSLLGACVATGIAAGSVVAGRVSGDRIVLALTPLGLTGVGCFSVLLAFAPPSYPLSAASSLLAGFAGGFFVVPFYAFLQNRAGAEEKGRLISTNNFLNTSGALGASAMLWILGDRLHISADRIILVVGLFTLLVAGILLRMGPDFRYSFRQRHPAVRVDEVKAAANESE
jgi:acyl-[acyl-carrier-protein]-phospholipid O-acyltransferase/long-chain-fatty-acid--[acyl-carrier-protein] ligase